jgi:anti-sigma factor RsiW
MTMNCDLAAELLPWLLNGTLEAGERRELIEHLRGCDACRAALAETQLAWDIFDWHPSAAALIAHAGAVEASPATSAAPSTAGDAGAGAIEEHLAGCPKCAAELELVRTSRLLADPAEDGRIAILPAPREEVGKRQGLPAAAAASAATATNAAAAAVSVAATPAPAATWGRRDDAAARRAWQRSALAAGVVGLLAATGWIESARHSRELERRLAAAPAVAPVQTGAASSSAVAARTRPPASPSTEPTQASSGPGEAELRRRAGEAEVRLRALADENRQLQQQVAALGSTATELSRRSDALQASRPAPGPRIESDVMVTDVEPADRAERGTGAPAAAAIPLSSGAATLLLHTRHAGSYPDYEIEVWDTQGRLVDKPTRVFRAPGGQDSFEEFDITLGRGGLAPGAYILHLFGRHPGGAAKGGREALETYFIRVS